MLEAESTSYQQQAFAAEVFTKEAIVATITMSGIAHYWVEKMFHMAAQLMLATSFREQLDQTIATGGVLLGNCMGQFDLMQATNCPTTKKVKSPSGAKT